MSCKAYSGWFHAAALFCAGGLLFLCPTSHAGDKIEFSSPSESIRLPEQKKKKESATDDLFGLQQNRGIAFAPSSFAPMLPAMPMPSQTRNSKKSKTDSEASETEWTGSTTIDNDSQQRKDLNRRFDLFSSDSDSEKSGWRAMPLPGLETRSRTGSRSFTDLTDLTESRVELSREAITSDKLSEMQNSLTPARSAATANPLDRSNWDSASPTKTSPWDQQSQKSLVTGGGLRNSDSRSDLFQNKSVFGNSGFRGQSSSSMLPERSRLDQPPSLERPKRPGDVFNVGK